MKKILSVILAVVLVATLSLSAAMLVSATSAQIVVSSATAKKGETKNITIGLKNNPGVASIKVKVSFPSDLTLEKVTFDKALNTTDSEGTPTSQTSKPKDLVSPATLNWVSNSQNVTGDITYATLQFTVADSAEEGDKTISLEADPEDLFAYVSGTYEDQDLVEGNVAFELVAGKITVVSCFHENTTKVAAVASTCKTQGHGAYTKCNDCGKIIEGSDEALPLDAENHEGGTEIKGAKDATCTEKGYTGDTYCIGCGAKIADGKETDMIDHTPASEWSTDSQCHWKECTVCHMVVGGDSEEHKFEEKVIKEATTEAEGQKGKVCSVCGYVDKESIEAIPKLISYDATQVEGKTENDTAVYDAKDAKAVSYTAKFAKAKLTAVKVNGEVVASDNYDVSEDAEGNVKVTFKEDYLKKLANGNYTVTVVADDGIAQSAFTVKNNAAAADNNANAGAVAATTTSPKMSDNDIALLILALLAVMGASIFAGVSYKKKSASR